MDKIIYELKKQVESYKMPDGLEVIPPYASIKSNPEELHNRLIDVTNRLNFIDHIISKMFENRATIDRCFHDLPNQVGEIFSKKSTYSKELQFLKDQIYNLTEAYKYAKEGLEASKSYYDSFKYNGRM